MAFTGVTVVDVEHGRLVLHQTVMIAGRRVQAVGRTGQVRVPVGARIVDASDKYLIPGLWDMHVHVFNHPDVFYPLLVANGVTGVREMSTPSLDSVRRWRREIAAGVRVGPRILSPGPCILGEAKPTAMWHGHAPWCVVARTPEEGRKLVDSLWAAGADFLKVYEGVSPETYFAIAAQARRRGLGFTGHGTGAVPVLVESDSGQHSLEHVNSAGSELVARCLLGDSVSLDRCRQLAAHLRRNDTWFVPTLVFALRPWPEYRIPAQSKSIFARWNRRTREFGQYWPDSLLQNSLFDGYNRALRESEVPDPVVRPDTTGSLDAAKPGALWTAVHAMVPMLAGTDVSPLLPQFPPGFALHEELELLVAEGLTPLDAVRAATLHPAQYLHATDSLGTVAAGKLADLVLLDADPLADIRNTQQIRAVVANGRYFDRAALDTLLAQVMRTSKGGPHTTP